MYTITKGKLKVTYDVTPIENGQYCHELMVTMNGIVTGMLTLFNKKKKHDAYQFYESIELVPPKFFKTTSWLEEWWEIIKELDSVTKGK